MLMTILRKGNPQILRSSATFCPRAIIFSADGKVYLKVSSVNIELYTDSKDLSVEQKLEAVLDTHGIFYDKTEVWIESEKLYEVLYSFEMEV